MFKRSSGLNYLQKKMIYFNSIVSTWKLEYLTLCLISEEKNLTYFNQERFFFFLKKKHSIRGETEMSLYSLLENDLFNDIVFFSYII